MESQPKNPELRNNPEEFHPCIRSLPLIMYAQPSSGARSLVFCLSLHLLPFFVYASNNGFDKAAGMCRLNRTLATSRWDYSKTCVKQPLSKRPKIVFQDQFLLDAGQKYCRMSILQYFLPSLSYHLSLRSLFVYF